MIIGPNGTGKSTFVCAVILGLGGNTKSLGRADRLSAYVRNGSDECDIDIELYEPEDNNVVVSRKIYLNNHSEFYINGRQVTAAKVSLKLDVNHSPFLTGAYKLLFLSIVPAYTMF